MFYAAADRGDRNNERAKAVLGTDQRLVTSDHVLVETWLLLARRLGLHAAETFWERLRAGRATVESVSPADLEGAFAIGLRYPDQAFSIVDRTSFAMMERLGIRRAASLDAHFAVYRFGRTDDRAFEIVR